MQGDSEMVGYLKRLVGYFLTASTSEQEIYYFYGSGANGKSTFLDLIKALLGSYGVKVSSDSFMKKSGGRSLGTMASLANLAGARLALTDETNDSDATFDSQTLKSISGDDEITGRFLRHNPITFKSTAKVVMYGNDKPHGNINDEGFWRRFRFIHFGHVIPPDERDKDLLDKLKAELPGILNWALDGLVYWKNNGIQTPQKIIDESADYRKDLDSVAEFLQGNTDLDVNEKVSTKSLFDRYLSWCENNLKASEAMQGFSKRTALYFDSIDQVKPFRNSKMRGYQGVRLS
jgi:putative DNA primase/helicase